MSNDFSDVQINKKFNGPVSVELLADGIRAVIENARGMLEDSKLLAEHSHNARAFSLSIMALEEVGKVSVLWKMVNLTPRMKKFWKSYWKEFRDHNLKSTLGLVQSMISEAQGDISLIVLYAIQQRLVADDVEKLRKLGMYVDYDSDGKVWLEPNQVPSDITKSTILLATKAIERQLGIQGKGMYDVTVLKLKQKMYASLQDEWNLADPAAKANLNYWKEKAKNIHKPFFHKLREMGMSLSEDELAL